jgi:inosine-uridine nucleoside N-ribohydrolase
MNDDCMAAIFALKSPDIELLGITPVMGNFDLNYEMACALRLLELLDRKDIPVCRGFDCQLIHARSDYADRVWGRWATHQTVEDIPPGMPEIQADARHAANFIGETVLKYPGDVSIVAVGPLTNVAMALKMYPEIADNVKEIIVMGGAIGRLPRGEGNITPSAEFNFWVDPESAKIVLQSGAPMTLVPLNVTRRSYFARFLCDRIVSVDNKYPEVRELFAKYVGPHFNDPALDSREPILFYGLTDHACIGYIIQPDIFEYRELCVEISINKGLDYGTSYGYEKGPYVTGNEMLPMQNHLKPIKVAYNMNFDKLTKLYLETITGRL